MPFVLGWVLFSILAARLSLRIGYRRVVLTGMGALVLAFVLMSGWNETLTVGVAARDMTLAGAGMGMIFVPMLIAVQSAVPRTMLGSATSLTSFFRTIGGAVGVAVMGAAMTHRRLERALAGVVATAPDGLRSRCSGSPPTDLVVNPITRATLGSDLLGQTGRRSPMPWAACSWWGW
jgi:MFS family permease